jgi:hypothetical protein
MRIPVSFNPQEGEGVYIGKVEGFGGGRRSAIFCLSDRR